MIDKLESIIKKQLELPEDFTLEDEITPEDIDTWDSLAHMKLVAEIETSFGVQFDFEEMLELSSVENIKKALQKAKENE